MSEPKKDKKDDKKEEMAIPNAGDKQSVISDKELKINDSLMDINSQIDNKSV